ncbi:MAG: hypothetical protein JST80_10545 [Bdellovibrionales bacterium]|nr:hypothetical protein [Bdellovibrionales bacterium]
MKPPKPGKTKFYLIGCLISLSVLSTNPAFAQSGRDGHGGRAFVCYGPKDPLTGKRKPISAKLVDYEEARVLSSWTIDLGPDSPGVDDTQTMIDLALNRLYKKTPYFADKIRNKLTEIASQEKFIDLDKDGYMLALIPDAKELVDPPSEDCVPRQAAFNRVKVGMNNYKYIFVQQFYDLLSDRDRAGLRLHEAIYNLEAELDATNSDGVREFNRAISSTQFDGLSFKEFAQLVKENLRFQYWGYPVNYSTSRRFYSGGSVRYENGVTTAKLTGMLDDSIAFRLGSINPARLSMVGSSKKRRYDGIYYIAQFDQAGVLRRLQIEVVDPILAGGTVGTNRASVKVEIAGNEFTADLVAKVPLLAVLSFGNPHTKRNALIIEMDTAGIPISHQIVDVSGDQRPYN